MPIARVANGAYFLGISFLVACNGHLDDGGVTSDASAETSKSDALIFPLGDTAIDTSTDAAPIDDSNPSAIDTAIDDTAPAPFDAGPEPTIDLSTAIVLNSPPDIASWPETTTISELDLQSSGVYVNFDKRDDGSWPDVPFGAPGDSLEYTLWIVLNIDGQWYTSGCIQYWRGLDRNGGPPSGYAADWYYDASRWAPMTGHQPAIGEWVGFFVSAGNARNVTDDSGSTVYERSNVVVVPFPSDDGATFNY